MLVQKISFPTSSPFSLIFCCSNWLMLFRGLVIVGLKVASYALTNRDLRDMYLEDIPTPEQYKSAPYPENINLSNLLYFWWAPTLIYQPVYPRTKEFRWAFFL